MTAAVLFQDYGHWYPVTDADPRLYALYRRHYSYEKVRNYPGKVRLRQNGRTPTMGAFRDYLALLGSTCQSAWLWVRPPDGISQSGQRGVVCQFFRNESDTQSSDLIREASDLAWRKWPGQRLYTYVWDAKVRSVNPGYCFKRAGWRTCGRNADGRLTLLECLP